MCLLSYKELLSWKLRCIILILKANEAHFQPIRGVEIQRCISFWEGNPAISCWLDTAPRLMAGEGKQEFTNSGSILWSLLCWSPGNLHWARKVKSAQAIKLVKDSSVSESTLHWVIAAGWELLTDGFLNKQQGCLSSGCLESKEVAGPVLWILQVWYLDIKLKLRTCIGLNPLGVLCRRKCFIQFNTEFLRIRPKQSSVLSGKTYCEL